MRERMLAGEPYLYDLDPAIAEDNRRATRLFEAFNASPLADLEGRRRILAELLGSLGDGANVRPPLYCDYGWRISIGDRSFVNHGLVALDVAEIRIGADVKIGPYVQLLTATHPVDPVARLEKWEGSAPITIGDNAWIGAAVIVMPGVSIGDNTVVGAGAVVTKDLPANVVAVGNPARVVREL
ncbi:MAG TPA: sugar O-acetyltransferase [Actinomycetota bacterium]|nr:sugar O-acetyltransferase [Actinomycetota bacterium]